jgi:hypothetical protein
MPTSLNTSPSPANTRRSHSFVAQHPRLHAHALALQSRIPPVSGAIGIAAQLGIAAVRLFAASSVFPRLDLDLRLPRTQRLDLLLPRLCYLCGPPFLARTPISRTRFCPLIRPRATAFSQYVWVAMVMAAAERRGMVENRVRRIWARTRTR